MQLALGSGACELNAETRPTTGSVLGVGAASLTLREVCQTKAAEVAGVYPVSEVAMARRSSLWNTTQWMWRTRGLPRERSSQCAVVLTEERQAGAAELTRFAW